jgi:hypothetical protein
MHTAIIMDNAALRQRPTFKSYHKDVAKKANVSEDVAKLFVGIFNGLYRRALEAGYSVRFPGIGTLYQLPEEVEGVCLALVPGVAAPRQGRRLSQDQLLKMAVSETKLQLPTDPFYNLESFVKQMWSAHIKVAHDHYRNRGGFSLERAGVLTQLDGTPTWFVSTELHLAVLSRRLLHSGQ